MQAVTQRTNDSGSYAEELAMDVDNGLSSVTGTVPAAEGKCTSPILTRTIDGFKP
jgi:hypothetical protein